MDVNYIEAMKSAGSNRVSLGILSVKINVFKTGIFLFIFIPYLVNGAIIKSFYNFVNDFLFHKKMSSLVSF